MVITKGGGVILFNPSGLHLYHILSTDYNSGLEFHFIFYLCKGHRDCKIKNHYTYGYRNRTEIY